VRLPLRRSGNNGSIRLFFATDLHGSEVCFRKFLAAASVYRVDVLVLGGDLTGKTLFPVVRERGRFTLGIESGAPTVETAEELDAYTRRAADRGGYGVVLERDEADGLAADDDTVHALIVREAARRASDWRALAEERLAPSGVQCFVSGGNDDPPEVLDALRGDGVPPAGRVVFCDGLVTPLVGDWEIASLGYSNPTPWRTPREVPEDELEARVDALADRVRDPARTVFNLHVPPVGSGLDRCPELDVSTDPPTPVRIGGELVFTNAGSTAVREALLRYQPPVSLHGHIHESRAATSIGKTLALNPGSEYGDGVLRGVIVTLSATRVVHQFTAG
jgi:Icc-related predicted phosphoesterase